MKTQNQLIQSQIETHNVILAQVKEYLSTQDPALYHRPRPQAWNCLDCIQHLNQSLDFYLPRIQEAIHNYMGPKVSSDIGYKPSYWGAKIGQMQAPKNGKRRFKAKTFRSMRPAQNVGSAQEVAAAFVEREKTLIRLMQESRYLPMTKIKVVSAIGSILRFQLGDLFVFITSHHQRHILQAQEAMGLPNSLIFVTKPNHND